MAVSTASVGLCKALVKKFNPHNRIREPGSRITFAISVICATALVLSSMGFGAVFAYSSGLQHGLELAVLSVVFAVALEGIKPLAVAAAFQAVASFALIRGLAMTLLGVVAVAYSLTAELSLLAQTRGDATAKREAAVKASTSADQQRQRVEAELSSLGITRPAGEIEAEISRVFTANRIEACEPWLQVKQRTICAEQIAPLKAELARAQRTEVLERELSSLGKGITQTAGAADAGAAALSTYLAAVGVLVPVHALSQWLVLVSVFALELGSALSVVLVRPVSVSVRTTVSYSTETPVFPLSGPSGQTQSALPSTDADKPAKHARRTVVARADRTAAQDAILSVIKQDGGRLDDGRVRTLAKRIGASRSTAHVALLGLISAGTVVRVGGELVLRS